MKKNAMALTHTDKFFAQIASQTGRRGGKKNKAGGYGMFPDTKKEPRFSEGAQDKPARPPESVLT